MDKLQETENSYVSELKSLFQDKFFMLLLGISVAIVLLSTVYSAVKPKSTETASNVMVQEQKNDQKSESSSIAGIEENTPTNTPVATDTSVPTNTVAPTQVNTKTQVKTSPTIAPTNIPSITPVQNVKPGQKEYTVKSGDTLWAIAEMAYGSGYNFVDIAKANNISNYNMISEGTKLNLPQVTAKAATKGDILPEAASTKRVDQNAKTHKVVEGDNLWNISTQYFGNGFEWPRLAKDNNIPNPDLIYPGQMIMLRK
ncbi:MAG: LysM peptidoglycan-binding domain-containing protein [Patescibacteria group bacterium]